jgi:DNA-binding transcriptional LysR family regulator
LGAAFQGLLSAVEQLQQRSRSDMTVSVGSVFASRFLTPRLPSFLYAYPDADLRLEISSSLTDLTRKEVDVGIRFGKGGWPGTRSVRLRESSLVLVCSPKLAQTLVSPAALTEVPIIHDVSTAEGWHDWLHQAEMDPGTILKFVQTYSDPTLAFDAALNSNGVWLAVDIIVSDALKTGLLVEPTGIRVPATSHYWLVTAEGRKQPDLVRSFCRWLRSEASPKGLLPAGGEMDTPLSGG